jgi:hypothetical protein
MECKNHIYNEKYYIDKPYMTEVVFMRGDEKWRLKYLAWTFQLDILYVGQ